MRRVIAVLLFVLVPTLVEAQTVRADRFVLSGGPCVLLSGTAQPEGVVTGNVCDTYWRTTAGTLYMKQSGTGNTGWVKISVLAGSGTTDTVAKWVTPQALGDSSITDASGLLTFAPSGNIIVNAGGKNVLPDSGYDTNLGGVTKKYLTLHAAELWVETLVAQNTLATIGGRILVAPTNILATNMAPAASSFTVKYNNFASGDRVYMESGGNVEFMAVTSSASGSAGAYLYSVTRDLDGSGANQWYAGDAILNTGTTGGGFIDLYSVRGIKAGTELGPTIVGNVRQSATYNDWAPRWAIGNLDGLYGYSGTTYGTAFGNPAAAWVKIDSTNGVRLGHNATTTIQMTSAGELTLGPWVLNNSGFYRDTGTAATSIGMVPADIAYYAGAVLANRGTAPFRVTAAGALTATSATITGSITSTSGTIGGFVLSSTYLTGGATNATRVVVSSDGTNAFWAGHITATSAPFRVLSNGTLTATSATITGDITATSGNVIAALAAGSITSSHIAANTIVAADIAAGTITATEIAANTITAAKIAAGTITATEIASSTITAGNIASGTITADRMNVSDLSAISANIGSITAGSITGITISGSTINAGSGNEVVLDSNGLTIVDWVSDDRNALKWTGGTKIFGFGNTLALRGGSASGINIGGSDTITMYGDINLTGAGGAAGIINWPGSFSGGGNRVLCVDNNGTTFRGASNTAC